MQFSIEVLTGNDAKDYIETISKLRIETFKDYPYLYEGTIEHEKKYLNGYISNDLAIIGIAKLNNMIAGISTGIPLSSDSEIVADAKQMLSAKKTNIEDYYYYGEIIVLPEFRNRGIAKTLCSAQDELIKTWNYKYACMLTVIRPDDHPLKPKNYQSKDNIWNSLGFSRTNMHVDYYWPTIQANGAIIDSTNTLEFWTKNISTY